MTRDKRGTSHLGVDSVVSGVRTVKNHSVRIDGERFGGMCLAGMNGEKIRIAASDSFGLEFDARTMGSEPLGTIKYLKERPTQ